ncbi:hypothetical protein ACA910_003151 [Epithemia clementina (nom. ined.)]
MNENEKPDLKELRRLRLARLLIQNNDDTAREDHGDTDIIQEKDCKVRSRASVGETEELSSPSSPSSSPIRKQAKRTHHNGHEQQNQRHQPQQDVIDLCNEESSSSDNDSVVDVTVSHKSGKAKRVASSSLSNEKAANKNDDSKLLPSAVTNWAKSGGAFSVCTYNVWFGPGRDGAPFPSERMQAIVGLLQKLDSLDNPLWFVGFQEIVGPLSKVLVPLLRKVNFKLIHQPVDTRSILPYGCLLAVRQSGDDENTNIVYPQIVRQGWKPYSKTKMERGFLYAHCRFPSVDSNQVSQECLVTTTHLESFISAQDNGAETRAFQVLELQQFCLEQFEQHPNLKTAIIMGDLNWDDESRKPSDKNLLQVLASGTDCRHSWKDAWLETAQTAASTMTSDEKKGYTYDSKSNPMLGGNLRRRFDRCMVLQQNTQDGAKIRSTKLIGQQALSSSLTWQKLNPYTQTTRQMPTAPSDHFGLVTSFSTT